MTSSEPWARARRRPSASRAVATLWQAAAAILIVVSVSCGDDPGGGGPTPPPDPALDCPGEIQLSTSANTALVNYPPAVARGGSPPVRVTCSPPSGSEFSLGTTTVACTGVDALSRSAACSFSVRVRAASSLTATKFLAFGDSLTEGTTSPDPMTLLVNAPDSYPFKLELLLASRYQGQTIAVLNEGCGGEFISGTSLHCMGGTKRLPLVLREHTPQVLLLMHGANDLLNFEDDAIPAIITGLEQMVRAAKDSGVSVVLAGLPPQNPLGSRGQGADEVPLLNAEIAKLAQRLDVTFLDLFARFGGSPSNLIGVDGLHPTASGYQRIAEGWLDAIRARFESPAGTGLTLTVAPQPPSPRTRP